MIFVSSPPAVCTRLGDARLPPGGGTDESEPYPGFGSFDNYRSIKRPRQIPRSYARACRQYRRPGRLGVDTVTRWVPTAMDEGR